MKERIISACERNNAVRIDIREVPLGPFPGFDHRIPRAIANIRIPIKPFDNAELLAMAQEQKKRVLSFGKHYNSLALHFWTTEQKVGKEEAIAIVDFAPGGLWEEAISAKIGDYSTHSFRVMSNHTGDTSDQQAA